jgi:hypothetical protein
MRAFHVASSVALFALLIITPTHVRADHCGATGTITPSHGPAGSIFVFRTNLGAPSDLSLYRNGSLVRSVTLPGDGFVRYAIRTDSGDAGRWRARAVVRGSPDCVAEVMFTVGGPPDTATASGRLLDQQPGGAPLSLIFVVAGLAAFVMARSRFGGRRSPS